MSRGKGDQIIKLKGKAGKANEKRRWIKENVERD